MSEEKKPEYVSNAPMEFIPAEEFDQSQEQQDAEIEVTDWESTMRSISERKANKITIPRGAGFNRSQVVQAFDNAFQLIGGTPRLALWADENPKEFFKLYAKLLPSQSTSSLGESTDIVIKHVLPKSPLDE
tara:strand:- start:102 stop:494 length:393 start_codon:yes stop_codon:yes gene_type:complete